MTFRLRESTVVTRVRARGNTEACSYLHDECLNCRIRATRDGGGGGGESASICVRVHSEVVGNFRHFAPESFRVRERIVRRIKPSRETGALSFLLILCALTSEKKLGKKLRTRSLFRDVVLFLRVKMHARLIDTRKYMKIIFIES